MHFARLSSSADDVLDDAFEDLSDVDLFEGD
jgi:hypothetical protein